MNRPVYPLYPILIVDDDPGILQSFSIALRSAGIHNIVTCSDAREVMPVVSSQQIGVILLDLAMPHISGELLLTKIVEDHPGIPVIVVTGDTEIDTAVRCMKAKAFDYMVKPVERSRLVSGVKRAIEISELRQQVEVLRKTITHKVITRPDAFSEIVTNNHVLLSIFRYAECIASSPEPILITGETGVGKELMARAIHKLSGRKGKFVAVNVAGLDDNIFSDTLFGHVKGAFTGADKNRPGIIEQAAEGTLLLDEAGDLSQPSQVKLLRLLQEREYLPLGSDIPKISDARIIVTTNRDPDSLRNSRTFRKDLFYRLSTHHIHIPPLRERLDDIPLLLDCFVNQAAEELGKTKPSYPEELVILLTNYHFPGNIRELRTMVYDAVGAHKSKMLSMNRFKMRMEKVSYPASTPKAESGGDISPAFLSFRPLPTLNEATTMLISEAMKRAKGNQTMAARMLGISRNRLARHLRAVQETKEQTLQHHNIRVEDKQDPAQG